MLFRAHLLAFTVLTVWAGDAAAQAVGDACVPDQVDAQGAVTTPGNFPEVCSTDTTRLLFCRADTANPATGLVAELNCSALFTGAPVGRCQDLGGTTGATCAFADGDTCVFASQTNPFIPFPCQNSTSGCVNGTCAANVGACTASTTGSCLPGGEQSFCAPWGQQIGFLCDGWAEIDGLTATGLSCTGGICGGGAAGSECATGFYECAAGLSCDGESAEALGTCGDGSSGGEGEGEGEGEDDCNDRIEDCDEPPPPAALCSGVGFNAAMPTFAGLALALVALRRRRR